MIINDLDFGPGHPPRKPMTGLLLGSAVVEGNTTIVYGRSSIVRSMHVSFWAAEWQAIGGAAANTQTALNYLLRQGEELAGNPLLNPVFIQWSATAAGGGAINVSTSHDGWYVLEAFEPDYENFLPGGQGVLVKMSVALVGNAPPQTMAQFYSGGALSSNYSGTSQIAIGYPFAAANQAATAVSRTGGEGAVPLSIGPATSFNPLPFTPSATIANWFLGGCHVYDTLTVGGNAVPTGGTFTHANWVEVKGIDHDFLGDVVVTNGLLLLRFQTAAAHVCTSYLWSTAQSTPGWLSFCTLEYADNAGNAGTLYSVALNRVGLEDAKLTAKMGTSAGNYGTFAVRLQRGMQFARIDFSPAAQANTAPNSMRMTWPASAKFVYNSTLATDNLVGGASLAFATDYGYAAGFVNNTAQPFVAGFLYQNEPANQPVINGNTLIDLGDTSGPAQNVIRSYGLFAVPLGTSTTTTDKLQGEAESGTLGTGWTSQANAAASGGNEAKCASGTVATNADTFGTAFIPAPGTYDIWFRMKVTTNVGSAAEMTVGLWNNDTSAYVASTTFNRTALTTSYAWYRAAAGVTPTATKNMRFRAVTALTLGTDWFIDEAVMAPITLSGANTGPKEIFQQFLYDCTVKTTRP